MAGMKHRFRFLSISTLLLIGFVLPQPSQALEAFDGRLQAHGFYEMQLRSISRDFGEDWDVTQWYNVFNLELELDIIQDRTFGIDMLSAYVRLEVRFDCIYSRGCGMIRGVNAFGDRSKSLPRRLSNGNETTYAGTIFIEEGPRLSGATTDPVPLEDLAGFRIVSETDPQTLYEWLQSIASQQYFPQPGGDCYTQATSPQDTQCWSGPRPFDVIFGDFEDYKFTQIQNRIGKIRRMGPWLPKNEIETIGSLADVANPFDSTSQNEVLFRGYRDPYDFRKQDWVPDDATNPAYTVLLDQDDPVDVHVTVKDSENTGNSAFLRIPMVQPTITSIALDDDKTGEFTSTISFPALYAEGGGARPFRPMPLLDHEEAHWFGPELEELELNVDCTRPGGGARNCYFEELDTTIKYGAGVSYTEIPASFSQNLGEYYRENQRALRTVCQAGELGCLSQSWTQTLNRGFSENSVDGGAALTCAGCDVTLDEVVLAVFNEIRALDCFDDGWKCSDLAIPEAEALLDELEASNPGFNLQINCPTGDSSIAAPCAGNAEKAEYLVRYGEHYVLGAFPDASDARGGFVPSKALVRMIDSGRLSKLPLNYTEKQRAFNRGASQQDEKELKEAYLDAEFFDSRLWLRIGKQSIVWGKTELFRTTDQFNPQDFSLATLPSLEESRISLWAFRAVYSLYEVGPLDDVRLEVAFNYDNFQGADLGACGEPYAPNVVCELALGAFVHGMTGTGIIGMKTPPDPWSSLKGWEVGGRVEWRYGRFSFALTDFWGYDDLPVLEFISHFERNVDPATGRPRRVGMGGPCSVPGADGDILDPITTGFGTQIVDPNIPNSIAPLADPACLRPGVTHREPYIARSGFREVPGGNPIVEPLRNDPTLVGDQLVPVNNTYRAYVEGNAFEDHYSNVNFFTWVCSATVGFVSIDPTACAQTVFGSTVNAGGVGPLALTIGAIISGNANRGNEILTQDTGADDDFSPVALPLIQLDLNDADLTGAAFRNSRNLWNYGCWDPTTARRNFNEFPTNPNTPVPNGLIGCGYAEGLLSKAFTPEQEALLGCGPFFGTNCDFSGLDLLNAEASALMQSFVGIEGSSESLALLRQQVELELIDQGREEDLGRILGEIDHFRTDGWKKFLQSEGINEIHGLQPGTARYVEAGLAGPRCSTGNLRPGSPGATGVLPGCRGLIGRTSEVQTPLPVSARYKTFHEEGADDLGFYVNPQFFLYHPYEPPPLDPSDPDYDPSYVPYEDVACNPYRGVCAGSLASFNDSPEHHNKWDEGYRIDTDGNPFKLYLQKILPSSNLPLRLPDNYSVFTPFDSGRDTGSCPSCVEILGGFVPNTFNLVGQGHPFTGDVFSSEMAALSFNFMAMLVLFDEEYSNTIHTLADGPYRSGHPPAEGNSFANGFPRPNPNPTLPNLPTCLVSDGNQNRPANITPCQVERRRFVTHYAYSGSEWATRPNDEVVDDQLFRFGTGLGNYWPNQNLSPSDLTYGYVENQFIGREIWEAHTTNGTGEYIEAGEHCSFVTPQYCELIQDIFAIAGVQNKTVEAGGNGTYGRRTFIWQSGGEVMLAYDRRNVLGFAVDFAEDVTKSNWGVEFTWMNDLRRADFSKVSGLSEVDEYNLTISMDRPTFINFLNPNRTFFLNTQWFFQYRQGYNKAMPANGPWNVLGLFLIQSGYFQDRLLPSAIFVYDIQSGSGAAIPQLTYRYSENFSVTIGAGIFMGREQLHQMPLSTIGPADRESGKYAYQVSVENALSLVRDRDEVFLRLRYTF